MYTVLLADDELPILDTLKNSIAWQQFGIDSLLTAADGIQALELMELHRVDLLITDIRMPRMDGLELLRKVRTSYPDTHCILLTAYGEFEYAKAAIQLGVENYLLKPFQKNEMEETIEKALDNIYTSRENSGHLFRNNILLRWVSGSISPEELSERSSLLDINIYLSGYCTVCMKKKQETGSLSAYRTACMEELSKNYEIYRFRDDKNRHVFILGGTGLHQSDLAARFAELAAMTGAAPILALAVGKVVPDSDSLAQSYQSACDLLDTSDLSVPDMQILTGKEGLPIEKELLTGELLSLFHQESDNIRRKSYCDLAVRLLGGAKEGQKETSCLFKLTHSLLQLFTQEFPNQRGIQDQLHSSIHVLYAALSTLEQESAMIEMLEHAYLQYSYHYEQLSPLIRLSIDYVHNHYAESLSIKEFCVKNKMSTNYLGFLFKKETGMFFNNYLNQFRICRSIELLRDTDKKIGDIAQRTGFSSTSYYISCFKKQTGLSPIKYRSLQFEKNI